MKISALIVDDEPLARERIRTLLDGDSDIAVAGEASNGKEALEKITDSTVDLIFLDIQMPELDGLRLIEKIPPNRMPLIVFTTAFDSFAVKAFEINAIDYLLKPFTKKRFHQALAKVKEQFQSDEKDLLSSRMVSTLQSILQKKQFPDRIVVKCNGKIQFVAVNDVLWAESDANYINLHTANGTLVMRETMSNFAQRLDPSLFLRSHRSVIVNVNSIKEIKPWYNDELVIILNNGTQLPVGRSFRKSVLQTVQR